MKRLFLTIIFLLCCALPAFATEITVGSSQWPNYRYAGTIAKLRIYYPQSFLSNTNVNIAGGAVGSNGFYKQVNCTITSAVLNCDSFTLQSTQDSNKPNARFFAVLYDQSGARRETLMGDASGWIVPASPTTTTVAQLQNAQGTGIVNPPISYLNSAQVAALIATAVGTLNTSAVGVLGRIELSTPPADAAHPIALGPNDPSLLHGTLTEGAVPRASGTKDLEDSQIVDDSINVSIQTTNAVQMGDFNNLQNGSYADVNDTLGRINIFAGGNLGAQYAGFAGVSGASDAEVFAQSTGFTNLYGHKAITKVGDGLSDGNGTQIVINDSTRNVTITGLTTTLNGTVTVPTPFKLGAVTVLPTGTELNFVDGVTSNIQTQLDGKQPLDGDLTVIAGLAATTDNFLSSVGSAWASRTPAQVKTTLALNNLDNTSDANKPVSTAQLTALNLKANAANSALTGATTADAVAINNGASLIEGRLSTSAAVNFNTATATTLYTCPSGKSCVITKVIIRNASTSLTTASVSFGWTSAAFADVIANAAHTELTGATLYTALLAKAGSTLGTSTGTFKVLCNTLQGGAATVTIDIFGYTF